MRKAGYSYTVERGNRAKNPNGIAVHIDGTGCPFWIMPADRNRAWTEAATDWRSPQQKLAEMLDLFSTARAEDEGKPARVYGGVVLPPQPMPYDPATDGPIIRLREDQ
jgi:hypothetical protein